MILDTMIQGLERVRAGYYWFEKGKFSLEVSKGSMLWRATLDTPDIVLTVYKKTKWRVLASLENIVSQVPKEFDL